MDTPRLLSLSEKSHTRVSREDLCLGLTSCDALRPLRSTKSKRMNPGAGIEVESIVNGVKRIFDSNFMLSDRT